MIKVISLDIGGTLIKYDDKDTNKYNLHELSKIVDLPYKVVLNAYKDVFQKKEDTFNNLVAEFCSELNIEQTSQLIHFFKAKFKDNQDSVISIDNIKIIKELKKKGYKVILFSNSCCLQKDNVTDILSEITDGIFYSYKMGYTKSDDESYEYIETKLKNTPEEFLHIGDTLKSDYVAPIKHGWNALLLSKLKDNDINSITNLYQIFNYLDTINTVRGK